MEEAIIALLSERKTMSLDITNIAKKLGIKNKNKLQLVLNKLVNEEILDYSPKKDKYLLFTNSNLIKAKITIDKKGNGLAIINGERIHIPKRHLKGASHNDIVALTIDDDNYGIVSRILEKDNSNYVGEVITKNNKLYIKDKRLGTIPVDNNMNLVEGQKVLLHQENGEINVLGIIGHKDDPEIDIKKILYEHDFCSKYNSEVLSELEKIPTYLSEQEIQIELNNGRVDYRQEKIVTIDCDDTKDIDDGISIKQLPNGYIQLKVFIADVAHYVKENSAIDKDSHKRGTSVYPPGSVDPMLDHKLSNGICSLNPNVDRLAMCYTTTFNSNGKSVDFRIEEAIINSKKKMKYSDINKILEEDEIVPGYENYLKEIYLMYKLSLLINKNLKNSGHLDFISSETKVLLDEDYNVERLEKRYNGPAEKIIEYFMIATNIEIAQYALFLDLPHIYRIHGEPNQDKLATVHKLLRINDYIQIKEKKNLTNTDIQKIIKSIETLENVEVFSKLLITCQDKAKYSPENIGHYAIGTSVYSHNTSPIRRRPDLVNQRIIKSFLHKGLEYTQDKYDNLTNLAYHYSDRERKAEKAEREATNMKIAEYMESHIGETYIGHISYVSNFGLWVLLENGVEGFIHINNLPHDKYKYSEELIALFGKVYSYNIGDKLEVTVTSANKEKRTIDFEISKDYYQSLNIQKPKAKKRCNNNRN